MGKRWTQDEIALLRREYPHRRTQAVADDLGRPLYGVRRQARKLNIKKTPQFIAWNHADLARRNGVKGRFAIGNKPMGGFNDVHKPPQTAAIGEERRRGDGYRYRKVAATGVRQDDWRLVHLLIWEEHHGPVPPGHCITFMDGDRSNITIENLACISRAEMVYMSKQGYHQLPRDMKFSGMMLTKLELRLRQR